MAMSFVMDTDTLVKKKDFNMTQAERIYNYLKLHKVATSNELRSALHIVDVPKAVSNLKKRGIAIQSTNNKDNTVTYTLNFEPKPQRHITFEGGRALISEGGV